MPSHLFFPGPRYRRADELLATAVHVKIAQQFTDASGWRGRDVVVSGRVEIAGTDRRIIRLRPCGERNDTGQTHGSNDPDHQILPTRRPRPRPCGPHISPLHSITSSARASSVGGISRPSALAVLRLMTSSNLVACCTGISAGFSPLRILPAQIPTSRY